MDTLGLFDLDHIPIAEMDKIRRQVGPWSKSNFGENLTQTFPTFTVDADGPEGSVVQVPFVAVALGSLAPLMGVVEELGEYAAAKDFPEKVDALGDCGIYLCDYVYREQLTFQSCFAGLEEYWTEKTRVKLPIAEVGKLYHCHLKKIQGIRGMDDPARFREVQKLQVISILVSLCTQSKSMEGVRFEDTVSTTWDRVVQKRNWKAHKKDGNAEDTES